MDKKIRSSPFAESAESEQPSAKQEEDAKEGEQGTTQQETLKYSGARFADDRDDGDEQKRQAPQSRLLRETQRLFEDDDEFEHDFMRRARLQTGGGNVATSVHGDGSNAQGLQMPLDFTHMGKHTTFAAAVPKLEPTAESSLAGALGPAPRSSAEQPRKRSNIQQTAPMQRASAPPTTMGEQGAAHPTTARFRMSPPPPPTEGTTAVADDVATVTSPLAAALHPAPHPPVFQHAGAPSQYQPAQDFPPQGGAYIPFNNHGTYGVLPPFGAMNEAVSRRT